MPTPRPGQILGLVGTNGIGKSTALSILSGKTKPNLGRFNVNEFLSISMLFYKLGIHLTYAANVNCVTESTRLDGHFDVLSRLRAAELLHQDS